MKRHHKVFLSLVIFGSTFLYLAKFRYPNSQLSNKASSENANNYVYMTENSPSSTFGVSKVPLTDYSNTSKFSHLDYIIPGEEICQMSKTKENIFLAIIVCSAVKNKAQRQAIRETWGSTATKSGNTGSIRLAFLMGTSTDWNYSMALEEESIVHHDVIQMNFLDSYKNLTYKSIALLKWVTEKCPDASFVLKSDDDTYINIPNLVQEASRMVGTVAFGVLIQNNTPLRHDPNHKWFVSQTQYPAQYYPDYLSGTAYAMSHDSVPKLYAASQSLPFFLLEDVFVTGMCASKAGVKILLSTQFSYNKRPSTGCAHRNSISGHYVLIPEMRNIWKELQDNTTLCT